MSEEDIDLDRVITDPAYRRQVIEFLNRETPVVNISETPAAQPAGLSH